MQPGLWTLYVAAVSNSDPHKEITKSTVQLLCSFETIFIVPEFVYKKYFTFKYYEQYISCKTRSLKKFEIEEGEHGEILWPVYLRMFQQPGYKSTSEYMAENTAFIERLMSEKMYEETCQEKLIFFARVLQSEACIEFILRLDAEIALAYLMTIKGFKDKAAATAFVTGIEGNVDLLRSDELYIHTHEKLLDGYLKAKYTRARTKNGFEKVG